MRGRRAAPQCGSLKGYEGLQGSQSYDEIATLTGAGPYYLVSFCMAGVPTATRLDYGFG
jgi:hypothetical protein